MLRGGKQGTALFCPPLETFGQHRNCVHRSRVLLIARALGSAPDDVERFLVGPCERNGRCGPRRRNDSQMLPLWTEYLNTDRGRGVQTTRRINGEPVGATAFEFPEDPAVEDRPIRLDVERQDELRIRDV